MHLLDSCSNRSNYQEQNSRKSNISCLKSQVEDVFLKESKTTKRNTSQSRSIDNLLVAKIESKALDLQKKLDTQTYQIEILSAETQHFMHICQEQKQQISCLDVQMLRQEYVEQMNELVEQKQKISQLIFDLSQEYRQVQTQNDKVLQAQKQLNGLIGLQLEKSLKQKQDLLEMISNSQKQILFNEDTILEQEEKIDELRNIERKLFIVLKEMESLQKRCQ